MALALLLGCLVDVPEARGQQSGFETVTTIAPPPRARDVPPRLRGLPPAPLERETLTPESGFTPDFVIVETRDDEDDADDDLFRRQATEPRSAGAGAGAFDRRSAEDLAADREVTAFGRPSTQARDNSATSQLGEDDDPQQRTRGSGFASDARGIVDGDFRLAEPEAPIDGVVNGIDTPVPDDQRSDEDVAAFEVPPAGFDREAFSIAVSPILDERPRQLFRFEPFEPLGLRVGNFIVLSSIETATVFDGNVFQSSRARSDVAVEVLPTVRVVSDWAVHAVELRARGVLSRFREFDSENARGFDIALRGRLDVTRNTNVEAAVSRTLAQESRSSIEAGPVTSDRANQTTDLLAATLNHRFNRLSLQLRGSIERQTVSDVRDPVLGIVSNSDRNQRRSAIALRSAWEFKPTLSVFGEVELNRRDVEVAASSDGLSRDTRGYAMRAGIAFGGTDETLRGEFSVGYGAEAPDNGALPELSAFLYDANVAWRLSALTTLGFRASTSFDVSTIAGVVGSVTRTAGVELRHAFLTNLIGTVSGDVAIERFEGTNLRETEARFASGLEYFMNRHVAVSGTYTHTRFDSNAVGRDYRDDTLRLGLRVSH
ncbi:MAG: outer membrane beta-barrel protein [Hyphomicrobiaceae bacterium]